MCGWAIFWVLRSTEAPSGIIQEVEVGQVFRDAEHFPTAIQYVSFKYLCIVHSFEFD